MANQTHSWWYDINPLIPIVCLQGVSSNKWFPSTADICGYLWANLSVMFLMRQTVPHNTLTSICWSVCLSFCWSIYPSFCRSVFLSVWLSSYPSGLHPPWIACLCEFKSMWIFLSSVHLVGQLLTVHRSVSALHSLTHSPVVALSVTARRCFHSLIKPQLMPA